MYIIYIYFDISKKYKEIRNINTFFKKEWWFFSKNIQFLEKYRNLLLKAPKIAVDLFLSFR